MSRFPVFFRLPTPVFEDIVQVPRHVRMGHSLPFRFRRIFDKGDATEQLSSRLRDGFSPLFRHLWREVRLVQYDLPRKDRV